MARFKASGWDVQEIDGHDPMAIDAAIKNAKKSASPSMIACKTHIALGSSAQDTSKGHGALTDATLVADTKAAYGWTSAAFEIPAEIKAQWADIGRKGTAARLEWEARCGKGFLVQNKQNLPVSTPVMRPKSSGPRSRH